MLSFFVFLLKMITTTNYKPEKISIRGLQNKKSRTGNRYQNIPILYDERKAIVHLCGRFMVIPDYAPAGSASVVAPPGKRAIEEVTIMGDNFSNKDTYSIAIEVDADNRKLFEDFESELMYFLENYPGEPWSSSTIEKVRLIQKNNKVYLKLYFDEKRSAVPKFWKVIEKDGEERKRRIWDTESLNWKKIEGEIVFSIANIFIGRKQEPKSIICVAKEILVREIKEEKSYFSYETDEEDDEVSE